MGSRHPNKDISDDRIISLPSYITPPLWGNQHAIIRLSLLSAVEAAAVIVVVVVEGGGGTENTNGTNNSGERQQQQ